MKKQTLFYLSYSRGHTVGFHIDRIPKTGELSSSDLGAVKEMRSVENFESGCAGLILGFCLYLIQASRVSLRFYAHASGDHHRYPRASVFAYAYAVHHASCIRPQGRERASCTGVPVQARRFIFFPARHMVIYGKTRFSMRFITSQAFVR